MSQPATPPFDPSARHQQFPHLRPVRAFPARMGEQMVMGLADARQISDKMVFTTPAAQFVLPLFDGTRSLDQIVAEVGRGLTRPVLETLVPQLDDAGLLYGPAFDKIRAGVHAQFDSQKHLPPATTAAFAEALILQSTLGPDGQPSAEAPPQRPSDEEIMTTGAKLMREAFDMWIAEALKTAKKPSFDALPRAVVAPHLDYPRGWRNYASTFGRLRVVDRPDRVIILGTNHFGEATGVCACDKGYETPLGLSPLDESFLTALGKNLGADGERRLLANRFDHEREHSIELQIPWIQHTLSGGGSPIPVVGVLVHDPSVKGGESYDGNGLAFDPFVEALGATLRSVPGKTLVVASADLSHVGPAFGDQRPMAGTDDETIKMRTGIMNHDRDMLGLLAQGKVDELIASMAWQQNPTRWCSIGNLCAANKAVGGGAYDILHYEAAIDDQGATFVSSASMALT